MRLGTDEVRVAASIVHLGIAARLWSVALGAVAQAHVVPDLDPDRVMWRLVPPGPAELWADPPPQPAGPLDGGEDNLADALYEVVAEGHLAPLAQAIRRITPVSERLLWGNAASGLVGAWRVLDRYLHPDDPARADTAMRIAGTVQSRGHLRGTGTWSRAAFRRTTCCLYYRTPQGGVCGDCVFTAAPARHRAPGDRPR
ncbi:(2Fe-2S)-binding protein [Embleya scabrispora]|uniref:(2Fe-2S)-binding protein n=1 Tax=Embleya scabrispora TaxID=159449 RepID=UPI001F400240|nr:(2Fe-2S)-binding protein [Embleya scabrispora]